jgi:hypothetical protein
LSQNLIGKPLYPQCQLEGNTGVTFDNVSSPMQLDECFHLLAADCSAQKQFAVLVRKSEKSSSGEPLKDVKLYIGQTSFELSPSERHSRYTSRKQSHVSSVLI